MGGNLVPSSFLTKAKIRTNVPIYKYKTAIEDASLWRPLHGQAKQLDNLISPHHACHAIVEYQVPATFA